MEDYSDLINASSTSEEVDALKQLLFHENVKLNIAQTELLKEEDRLRKERKSIAEDRSKLELERKQLTIEMNYLKQQVQFERKRLRDEKFVIETQTNLLKRAYESLETDREQVAQARMRNERDRQTIAHMQDNLHEKQYSSGMFFRGVTNEVALKKRYKDLMKIFHPDNSSGDHEILLHIQHEYEELKHRLQRVI